MNILVASPISGEAVAELLRDHQVIIGTELPPGGFDDALRDAEVLIFRSGLSLTAETLRRAENLRLIIRAGSGMDNIDLDVVGRRGIVFERIPGPGARAVAELSFAMMLALSRNLFAADRLWRGGRWAKFELQGYLMEGKILGIVGAGNIGMTVGQLGAAWGMKVAGCVDELTPGIAATLLSKGITPAEFSDVVAASDFVSIHVPLTEKTRGLFDERVLRSMKSGSYLVNLARGGVVDEQALCRVLKEGGGLAGAALDVHAAEGEGKISPLAALPNVILTPHIGAQTVDTQREIGRGIVTMIGEFSKGYS